MCWCSNINGSEKNLHSKCPHDFLSTPQKQFNAEEHNSEVPMSWIYSFQRLNISQKHIASLVNSKYLPFSHCNFFQHTHTHTHTHSELDSWNGLRWYQPTISASMHSQNFWRHIACHSIVPTSCSQQVSISEHKPNPGNLSTSRHIQWLVTDLSKKFWS